MKTTILAVAMLLLNIMSMSQSLPLGSTLPGDAQAVIPLVEKTVPQEVPAADIPVATSDLKPEESKAAEPAEEIKEPKPAEPETKAIEEKSIIVPSEVETPKEIVPAVAAESSAGVKEEGTVLGIARSAEPEAAEKVDQAAPQASSIIEGEKQAVAEDATKGLISPIPEAVADESAKPAEQEAVAIVAKELPTELKSEIPAAEKEVAADVPAPEIKEDKPILESKDSGKKAEDEVIEAVDEIVKKSEEKPADDKVKAVEIVEAVPKQSEERSNPESEIESEAKEEKKEGGQEARGEADESAVKKVEESSKKEEAKKGEVEVKKEEPAEEPVNPIKPEALPTAEKLKEQPEKVEDPKDVSDESSEEDDKSQETDKNAVNKNEDDSSQEQSDEEPETKTS